MCSFCCNQGAGELFAGESGLGRNQDQNLIEVGCKGLGTQLVLAIKKVAPGLDFFYRSRVPRGLPQHTVADHAQAFLAPRVADDSLAIRLFDQKMAP